MTPRVRRLTTMTAALVVASLLTACGSARFMRKLDLPPDARLYVAVFVDETDEGRVGVPLADAVRVEVYRRDPARLAMSFEEGTWALDGTVLALEETPGDRGKMRLTVLARARLLNKAGDVVAVLGPVRSSSSYRVSRERAETEMRRDEALENTLLSLAREIVKRVEQAAAQEPAPVASREDAQP